jgi:hypothetical protein
MNFANDPEPSLLVCADIAGLINALGDTQVILLGH